jgi:hypothetical protein
VNQTLSSILRLVVNVQQVDMVLDDLCRILAAEGLALADHNMGPQVVDGLSMTGAKFLLTKVGGGEEEEGTTHRYKSASCASSSSFSARRAATRSVGREVRSAGMVVLR